MGRRLETGRYDVDYGVIRPNGDVRVVHGQGDLARDESGRPRRMFGSVQDITERKRAEQRLVVQHAMTQCDELRENVIVTQTRVRIPFGATTELADINPVISPGSEASPFNS